MGEEDVLDDLVAESITLTGSTTDFGNVLALIVVNAFTSILGTFGNILVCVTVYKTPSLRNNFGLLICSLALADFLVTFISQPALVFILIRSEIQRNLVPFALSLTTEILTVVSCSASLLSLCFLSMDRCLCILNPIRYKILATKPRVKAAIFFVWLVACSAVVRYFWSFMTPETFRMFGFVCLLLCYAVMCLCYALVFCKIQKQAQTRRKMRPRLRKTRLVKVGEKTGESASVDSSNAVEKKLARMIALVIGVFTLAWSPLTYVFSSKNDFSQPVVLWVLTVGFCNSSVNPMIYCYGSQECRKASWKLLSRWCRSVGAKRRVGTTKSTNT